MTEVIEKETAGLILKWARAGCCVAQVSIWRGAALLGSRWFPIADGDLKKTTAMYENEVLEEFGAGKKQ